MAVAAAASVVIPAHNEAALIASTLRAFLDGAVPGEFEVLVVCNGCQDETAAIAREHPGVRVIEIEQRSKIAALNAGDSAATVFPRIYLDADVIVETSSLRAVVASLRAGAPAASPLPVVDMRGCGWASRAYFSVWSKQGYLRQSMLGSGVYAMSEQGRARFGPFPDLIADDGFVHSLFSADERVNPPGARFIIQAPRTLSALVRRRVRINVGNLQLAAESGPPSRAVAPVWWQLPRQDPRLIPAVTVYAAVNFYAALVARRRFRSKGTSAWSQDRSIRRRSS